MSGPTLAMSPLFDTNSTFHHSHSSTDIPDLVNGECNRLTAIQDDKFPRSASFDCLATLHAELEAHGELQADTAVGVPSASRVEIDNSDVSSGQDRSASSPISKEERPKFDERFPRRKSFVARPKSWIQKVRGSPERQSSPSSTHTTASDAPPVPPISKVPRDKTKTVSESFATFARKSWITSSRSPSPSRTRLADTGNDEGGRDASTSKSSNLSSPSRRRLSWVRPGSEKPSPNGSDSSPKQALRTSSTFLKMKQRPQSVLMNLTHFNSANSSSSSLPLSLMDNKSTPRTSTDKVAPIPKMVSNEKLQSLFHETPRRRDELWSAFRSLENDFSKFQGKAWSLKTNVVRSALIPFLRQYATHPSTKNLRPEDLDRRVTILNKWWAGLLEVLDGRHNQTVSGVDRPVLLDAVVGIMRRPEWQLAPSPSTPLCELSPGQSPGQIPLSRKKSTGSLDSSASQFMVESVYHNVRSLFAQNLLSQMIFVVDKMSLRHAPASLVAFCGKAAAYAFFFVPGVAETLARIWKLPTETLRRVADEFGLPRCKDKTGVDGVIEAFPLHLQALGWTSVKSIAAQLRQQPSLSVLASKIPWHGPWVARWCGRESDLFFVFVKQYHILAEEFMPSKLTLTGKARSPGFLLVHAQILTALEATIHRQPPGEPLPATFDDIFAGVDASAAALPLPSSNSARLMAENRLIMLLREFIAEQQPVFQLARATFVEAFGMIMQAAARRTSQFDQNACFILCDFMEEALALFVRFHHKHASDSDFVNWPFWLEVCKKMLDSQNTMSEIRIFAFLYGSWGILAHHERRKEILCLDWLLSDDTFHKFFNHWCPMVRAYYMRLLCWRLCRDNGEATDLDVKIFSKVSKQVKTNWSRYLQQKRASKGSNIPPPSTSPCHPAPGRRLLIIRHESQVRSSGVFVGFDGIAGPSSAATTNGTTYNRNPAFSELSQLDTSDSVPKLTADSPPFSLPNKKRWIFMDKLLSSTSSTSPDVSSDSPTSTKGSPTKTLEEARRETALARSRPLQHAKIPSDNDPPPAGASTYRPFSFKFSLEWSQQFEKSPGGGGPSHGNGNGNGHIGNGRGVVAINGASDMRLFSPRLPGPAQARLGVRGQVNTAEVQVVDPSGYDSSTERSTEETTRAKYAGRALAEWALVVGECNNFIDRRRSEGVPNLRLLEIPTLGVEGFRRLG